MSKRDFVMLSEIVRDTKPLYGGLPSAFKMGQIDQYERIVDRLDRFFAYTFPHYDSKAWKNIALGYSIELAKRER